MRLPGAERAYVDPAKVRDYLLSAEHAVGRSKARFFAGIGFTRGEWPVLQRALAEVARRGEAEPGAASAFGQKYVVRGTIRGPAGRMVAVVTAWIVLSGEDFPRLITAFPSEGP